MIVVYSHGCRLHNLFHILGLFLFVRYQYIHKYKRERTPSPPTSPNFGKKIFIEIGETLKKKNKQIVASEKCSNAKGRGDYWPTDHFSKSLCAANICGLLNAKLE